MLTCIPLRRYTPRHCCQVHKSFSILRLLSVYQNFKRYRGLSSSSNSFGKGFLNCVFPMKSVVLIALLAFTSLSIATFIDDEQEEFLLEKRACPTIIFPCGPASTMPNVCKNMQDAIKKGHPKQLHRITDKKKIRKNRYDSGCTKMVKPPGQSCDEYPFASSQEGGTGAETMLVPLQENNQQGGLLSSFYRSNNIADGDCFNVQV